MQARNINDPLRVLEQGPDRQRAPDDCSWEVSSMLEPLYPDAAAMDLPAHAGKARKVIDTSLHRGNGSS
jgi:hypothetical protein